MLVGINTSLRLCQYYSIIVIVTSMSHTTNATAFKEDERRNTSI